MSLSLSIPPSVFLCVCVCVYLCLSPSFPLFLSVSLSSQSLVNHLGWGHCRATGVFTANPSAASAGVALPVSGRASHSVPASLPLSLLPPLSSVPFCFPSFWGGGDRQVRETQRRAGSLTYKNLLRLKHSRGSNKTPSPRLAPALCPLPRNGFSLPLFQIHQPSFCSQIE